MKLVGFVTGTLMIGGGAMATLWSTSMLLEMSKKFKSKNLVIIVERAGGKGVALFLQLTILFTLFGFMVVYHIFCILNTRNIIH